jgi:hypothetical protein
MVLRVMPAMVATVGAATRTAVVVAAASAAQSRRARVIVLAPFVAAICSRNCFGATITHGWFGDAAPPPDPEAEGRRARLGGGQPEQAAGDPARFP